MAGRVKPKKSRVLEAAARSAYRAHCRRLFRDDPLRKLGFAAVEWDHLGEVERAAWRVAVGQMAHDLRNRVVHEKLGGGGYGRNMVVRTRELEGFKDEDPWL